MTETFGQALRRFREQAGLSQPQLAQRAYISQPTISRIETGRQQVDELQAERLDALLGADGALKARLLAANAVAEVLNSDERRRIAYSIAHPSRVDGDTVAALAVALGAQRRRDDTLGPIPIIPVTMGQVGAVTGMLRDARGPYRDALAEVVAEYVQFAGWLHAEARRDRRAAQLLTDAEDLADDIENGTLAAQAANFKGYLARQQGRPRAVVRWFLAAHHTPGARAAQRLGDAAQAAQGYATLGERDAARQLLDVAGGLIDIAAQEQPPGTAYWLTPTFQRLNIGLAHLALNDHADAAEHIAAGLDGLPEDQRGADWAAEYQEALKVAQQSS